MATKEELEKKLEELEAKCEQEKQSRREIQQMFQLVMDSIPQFIFWKDTESVYLGCNQNFAQAAGVETPADIVGKTDYDLAWKKEEADAFRADDQEVMDNDSPKLHIIEPQLQADGKQAWLETNKIPLHDDEGKVIGVLGTFADITERKRTEESLRESEGKFRNIIESIPLGMHIYHLDEDDRLVFTGANQTADKLLGVDNSVFIGKSIEEAFPPLAETEVPQRYRAAAAKGESWKTEQISYDEGQIQGAFEVYAFQTSPGNMVAAFLDVTQRKKVEEEVLSSQRQLMDIIDFLPDATFVINREGKVIAWNRAMEKMTKIPKEEIMGKGDYAYSLPLYGEKRPIMVNLVLEPNEEFRNKYDVFEQTGQTLSGEIFAPALYDGKGAYTFSTAAPLFDSNGNIIGAVESIRDITDRKHDDEERLNLQQEVIDAQRRAIQELSTPVIPIMDRIIVMPMVGSIDSMRARDITRSLLEGIGKHRAKIVILDVTGVSLMDTGIVNHLNKTIQAARLKGAQTIVTGISDAVAESIVDLGIDWSAITTLSDLQTGLIVALDELGVQLNKT